MAETPCQHCGRPIGYGTRFYMTSVKQLAHAACEEMEWQKVKEAR
jgi:ribosomal protein S14